MRHLFEERYQQWKSRIESGEISLSSSARDYISNPEFEAIVELGEEALPFIFEKMQTDEAGHFLSYAVERITGRRGGAE